MMRGVSLLSIVLAMLASGCGYQSVTRSGLYREDVQTVAVTAAASGAGDLDLPGDVTAAVVRQIEAATPYRVADASTADSLLELEISRTRTSIRRRNRNTALPEQADLGVYGNATWTDLRTGKLILDLEDVKGEAEQFPTLGEGQSVSRRAAAEAFAQQLVEELAGRW